MARRGRRGRRSTQRSRNRARNRARAQRAAKKRVSARKAAGRKPSGANKAANRAAAKARAQAAAKKRIAQGRTISQTKAANTASMRKAAAERNRVFQQKKAAEAAARKARAEAKKQTPSPTQTFNKNLNTIQNKNLIASSMSAGSYGGYVDAGDARGFVSPEQAERMLKNPDAYKMRPSEIRYLRGSMGLPLASAGDLSGLGIGQATPSGYKPGVLGNYLSKELGLDPKTGRELPKGNPNVMSADGTFNRPGPGGPEPESDYTSYQPGSFYKQSDTNLNMTNALRSTRNLITAPARALGINNRLTNRLIPKSNEAIQDARDQRGPRPTLTRRRSGGGGGASRIAQQAAAQAIQPEIAPTIGTPEEELLPSQTAPQGDLTRIQNQAYNTQLTSSLAGMFGGQGSVGYTPQGSPELSPTLRAGRSRGRRRVRLFGARRRRGGTGDQFSRAGDRIAKLTNINI